MTYVEDVISTDRIIALERIIKPIYERSPITINRVRTADAFIDLMFSFLDNDRDVEALLQQIDGKLEIDCYGIIHIAMKIHETA